MKKNVFFGKNFSFISNNHLKNDKEAISIKIPYVS
jgi:hypothetical protein